MQIGDQVNSWVVDNLELGGKVTCSCVCKRTTRTEWPHKFRDAKQCFLCKQDAARANADERSKSKDLHKMVYSEYKSRAKLKKIGFELPYDTGFIELICGDCHYCGSSPSRVFQYKLGQAVVTGIDRVDSSIGYVAANVVSCCQTCNMMKRNMSPEQFLEQVDRIASNHSISKGVIE